MSNDHLQWWSNLRHGGLLLDMQRLTDLVPAPPVPLPEYQQDRLRREILAFQDDPREKRTRLVAFVLSEACGFNAADGSWHRGGNVPTSWTRRGITGEAIRPSHLWLGSNGTVLPVFIDTQKRLGIGRGRRTVSQVLQWLRRGDEQLAVLTNGRQWRLVFAGLDYEAFCEWDIDQWFHEGQPSPEFDGLRALLAPSLWTPPEEDKPCPLLAAINETRKGQADLSQVLGERVRQAAEMLIQAHAPVLNDYRNDLDPRDIYRAAVRMIMRMVVVLFAESREGLLPRDNPVYHSAYSLQGLREQLERISPHRLVNSFSAYPRILALLRLIHQGCSHEAMPVPAYGGELFAPGDQEHEDGMKRALFLMESACFEHDIMNDYQVRQILGLLSRTRMRIRQGRASTWVTAPVDFSSLDREYIGILYEGLLDFELRCAAEDESIVFLAIGNQPALPLSTLEQMDDRAIKNLLERLRDTSSGEDEEEETADEEAEEPEEPDEGAEVEQEDEEEAEENEIGREDESSADDARYTFQARAEAWARRACEVGGLVRRPRGRVTPERRMQYERALNSKARQLVTKVVLPGEWYLVRWGGTRKGSGTFYTRPQLAVPTAHRTLRPLAYDPPTDADGQPNPDAPAEQWTPKKPEEILSLKVCDPACGSGSFLLAALRFLTNALYESLVFHERIRDHAGRAVLDLIYDEQGHQALASEALPCRPDDENFEVRTKAILRRYVVERCIYGVDIDPLAVELARLSLWLETLDRNLPMTFLDHKVKCGNSLVGAWFDQFLHYPVMAWQREGGDRNHSGGVHFRPEQFTRAIRGRIPEVKEELKHFIDGGHLFFPVDLTTVRTGHDAAEAALREIHELGITQVAERSERYQALRASGEFQRLKDAFDLWCALWFWPAEQIDLAPLPADFAEGNIPDEAWNVVRQVAQNYRFFHWELEFPDVFNAACGGFDAILGNPPWDTLQPQSKEFFSAFDPLYRSYGKQEALRKQREYFQRDRDIERQWLDYCALFKAMSNWVKYAGFPFGDRVTTDSQGRQKHDFNLGDRGRNSFRTSQRRHERWKAKREESSGYADADHAFRHQGEGKAYTYKMFAEVCHALLRDGGRMGLIVPSGLYSDYGSRALRELLLDRCRWEWLFGFENREGIFDIHRSFKFNPVIIAKGGQTEAIRTAFMRRNLADWERAEQFATDYPREQVLQFSPNSLALLEIQSARDLEILTKIYSNSVLLGDQSERGWGIKYAQGDFNMTSDSRLFPPRPVWEQWGYRPDEYSRWIKGPWKPIEVLWRELGVDPSRPVPAEIELEDWLFDTAADPEQRARRCRRLHGHTLRPGDVQRTNWRLRCAQPPYDRLPIPRADIPPGIILSREADAWIREDEIPIVTFTDAQGRPLKIKTRDANGNRVEIEPTGPAIALPLYEGRMIGQFDFSQKGWVSGKGRSAVWESILPEAKIISPQFLMGCDVSAYVLPNMDLGAKFAYMDVASATNTRSMYSVTLREWPCSHRVNLLRLPDLSALLSLVAVANSTSFDWSLRQRLTGIIIAYYLLEETPLPACSQLADLPLNLPRASLGLIGLSPCYAPLWIQTSDQKTSKGWRSGMAFSEHERIRIRVSLDTLIAGLMHLTMDEFHWILQGCDLPSGVLESSTLHVERNAKGFWRVDKRKLPEHRHTVLSLVAFHDLQEKIDACGGDVAAGIEAFCNQNDGEGWMLPETLRLADYGLGHDDRAKEHQPVRACFGPRFYDWQLVQSAEESWRECHLHARNLLGEQGYRKLLAEIDGRDVGQEDADHGDAEGNAPKGMLFDTADTPLFRKNVGE